MRRVEERRIWVRLDTKLAMSDSSLFIAPLGRCLYAGQPKHTHSHTHTTWKQLVHAEQHVYTDRQGLRFMPKMPLCLEAVHSKCGNNYEP